MVSFINRLPKSHLNKKDETIYLQLISEIVQFVDTQGHHIDKKSLSHQLWAIHARFLQKFSNLELQEEDKRKIAIALALFIGIEIYGFPQLQNSISDYYSLIEGKNYINLWYCMKICFEDNEDVPIKLENIFKQEQDLILTTFIWKDNTYIDQVAELAANYEKNNHFMLFTQCLIEYCQNFFIKMKQELETSKDLMENAYNCLKFILSASGNVLNNRNLDQILCCCIYISGKVVRQPGAPLFT